MVHLHYNKEFITQAPVITDQKYLKEILLNEYGISDCKIHQLSGYDDLNFMLEDCQITADSHLNLQKLIEKEERKFILKFTNPVEAKANGLIDSQIKLMEVLLENDIPCAQTIPQKDGKQWKNIKMSANVELPVRLLSYLPGQILEDFKSKHKNITYNLIGNLLANFHCVCETKLTPMLDSNNKSVTLPFHNFYPFFSLENWDVLEKEFQELQSHYLHFFGASDDEISANEKVALCSTVFTEFKSTVLHDKNQMKHGIIHSDFNETNILLVEDAKTKISGLVDFGDTHHSLLIYDLANTIMYLFLDYEKAEKSFERTQIRADSQKLKEKLKVIGKHVFEGYRTGIINSLANDYKQNSKELKLLDLNQELELELEFIGICMRARLVLSLIYGLRTLRINYRKMDGIDYILKTQQNGWRVLKLLSEMDLVSMFASTQVNAE